MRWRRYRQRAGVEGRHVAAHRGHAGNEAADRLAEAGRRWWMVPERAAALISFAPSIPPEPEVHFVALADRIFWHGIKGLADSVSRWWSLLLAPPTSAPCFPPSAVLFLELVLLPCPGRASISLTSSTRRGFPSVRVAALGCSPRLPTKGVMVVLSCR